MSQLCNDGKDMYKVQSFLVLILTNCFFAILVTVAVAVTVTVVTAEAPYYCDPRFLLPL